MSANDVINQQKIKSMLEKANESTPNPSIFFMMT